MNNQAMNSRGSLRMTTFGDSYMVGNGLESPSKNYRYILYNKFNKPKIPMFKRFLNWYRNLTGHFLVVKLIGNSATDPTVKAQLDYITKRFPEWPIISIDNCQDFSITKI